MAANKILNVFYFGNLKTEINKGFYMSNIEVSIIIPMHNASRYIEKTLQSIMEQDFKDFEIILIDDGSNDDSCDIADKFLSKHAIPYIIYPQKNSGASSARNKGIDLSKGNYLLFLDDDDAISSNHISNLYNEAIKENNDFSFTYLAKIDEHGNILTDINSFKALKNKSSIKSKDLIKLEMLMEIPFYFVQLMYKKDTINTHNIRFSEGKKYGEDTEFALKALTHANNIGLNHEFTYFYLQREDSVTSKSYLDRFGYVNTLENFSTYYESNCDNTKNVNEVKELIHTNRIPKTIFGNLMFLFYQDYPFEEIMEKMNELNLFDKLKTFKPILKGDVKFYLKNKLFLLSPRLYYRLWKKLKNSI